MADLCVMFRRVADRAGECLAPVAIPGSTPESDGTHFFARLAKADGGVLRQEVGIHRGQLVPAKSQDGRICTSLVGVEVLSEGSEPKTGRLEGPVLRTYSYTQLLAFHHPTGDVFSLSAMFKGTTG